MIWLGYTFATEVFVKSHKGEQYEMCQLTIYSPHGNQVVKLPKAEGQWLAGILPTLSVKNGKLHTVAEVQALYEAAGLEDFELFRDNKPMNTMYKAGLLVI